MRVGVETARCDWILSEAIKDIADVGHAGTHLLSAAALKQAAEEIASFYGPLENPTDFSMQPFDLRVLG